MTRPHPPLSRVGLAATAVTVALAMPAATMGDAGPRPAASPSNPFAGQCHLTGRVRFRPGLRTEPQDIRQRVRAPGTCSGTFTDRRGRAHELNDGRAAYVAREQAPNASCGGGTASGRGKLVFRFGRIHFAAAEARAGAGGGGGGR